VERTRAIGWAFPQRLPLGAGFCGTCHAGQGEQEFVPDDATLRDCCNLGHAQGCSRIPAQRRADSLRFAVAIDDGGKIVLQFVYDHNHAPLEHGVIDYDCTTERWISTLPDACGQRQAECYLAVYRERRSKPAGGI
jgi:hypothetical protein